ncbi:MAG: hypothetical protein L6Q98_11655 [Anaerolineae bacterium]|nr:hypothetical protein [Anaerolineae bacterium]NUQ06938.1 hypothetical protein [Anaerolineae bacterium]
MRERAVATMILWISTVVGIDRLLASIRFSEWVQNPDYVISEGMASPQMLSSQVPGWYQTVMASGEWQLAVVVLIALIVVCVGVATIAMWANAPDAQRRSSQAADEASERIKTKRRDPVREARLRRLLDTLGDDDIEALEQFEVGDDGERVSVEALLRRR